MTESVHEKINRSLESLKLTPYAAQLPAFIMEKSLNDEQLEAVCAVLAFLGEQKDATIVHTLLKLSRLPLTEPKTFQNFDFSLIHGKEADALRNLSSLSAIYAKKNIAFIGPQGVGKTHLAMAFGRACCEHGMKAYFLKATELQQRFHDAIRFGRIGTTVAALVKPSCLIVDEMGRCVFDRDCTRLFFDLIDRRYNKEGPSTMIFTSNSTPNKWNEFFSEDSTLLCALDRIFDDATVFMMKGESYRGRKRETIAIQTGHRTSSNLSK